MRIEAHNGFGKPISQEITRLVVYDDHDNPILIALKYAENLCYAGRIGDDEFQNVLKMLGVNKTTILHTLDSTELNANPPKTIII